MERTVRQRIKLIGPHASLSRKRQCELLEVARSSTYYVAKGESPLNLLLMEQIDKLYTKDPSLGSPSMLDELCGLGFRINHKRVERLMRLMAIASVQPGPHTSRKGKGEGHKVYPNLIKGIPIDQPDKVWCSDITYIPVEGGFFYLTAVMDWYSRYILSWELSNSLDSEFCITVLEEALRSHGKPEYFHTDQGSQYTSDDFTGILASNEINISMSGKGRCIDNVMVERFWRSLKYREVYLHRYENGDAAYEGISRFMTKYCTHYLHGSLNKRTPMEVYRQTALKCGQV